MFISAESQVKGGNLLTPASFTSIEQYDFVHGVVFL
jgi:hypothetical protein